MNECWPSQENEWDSAIGHTGDNNDFDEHHESITEIQNRPIIGSSDLWPIWNKRTKIKINQHMNWRKDVKKIWLLGKIIG